MAGDVALGHGGESVNVFFTKVLGYIFTFSKLDNLDLIQS